MTAGINSSDTSEDKSIKNPNLDTRKLCERGETPAITKDEGTPPFFSVGSESSEVNQNKFNSVIKKEELQEGFSPKGSPDGSIPENSNFNMLINMSEKGEDNSIKKFDLTE